MATSKDPTTSDAEGQEKPVRKQLQKASLSHASGETLNDTTQGEEVMKDHTEEGEAASKPESPKPAPQVRKKRSFEEVEGDDGRPAARTRSAHTRKRSRDSTAEEEEINNGRKVSGERKRDDSEGEAGLENNGAAAVSAAERSNTPPTSGKRGEGKVEAIASPKTKRSRLHSATEAGEDNSTIAEAQEDKPEPRDKREDAVPNAKASDAASVNKKKPAETKPPTTIPPGSGFANTSTASPFGAISPIKSPSSEQAQTSSSAFAASGFGSLAGTATSGFGALGKSSGGPAGGWASKSTKSSEGGDGNDAQNGTAKPSSTFGGALGQQSTFGGSSGSAFGSGSSSFGGKLGGGSAFGGDSGFGSLGGGAGLSSFASGKASPFASGNVKPARPFGAPADDEEDDEGGDDDDGGESGLKSPLSQTSDKQDERFYVQDHETGEEGEVTEYSCRAKLYNFAVVDEEKGKKEWKERGLGTVRLNTLRPASKDDADSTTDAPKPKARLVMRADGSHRLVLNTAVQKDLKFGAPDGGPPPGSYLLFMGRVDGMDSLGMLQLKMKQQFASELYDKIKELQEQM